jgi:hypothetical protein
MLDAWNKDTPSGDGYWEKLGHLIQKNKGREIEGRMRLPKPIRISVDDVIRGLFSENRPVMLTNSQRWLPSDSDEGCVAQQDWDCEV